jgi:alkylation response protein AidB-like acyl-CoA dehydrogenase
MDFEFSARSAQLQQELLAFMDGHVYPAEELYESQLAASGDPHSQPPVMEELKAEARGRGLWNLFLPDATWGGGLNNTDYAPLAEIMGRSAIASEAVNCSAPDTGNMELLVLFGTGGQQRRSSWPPRRPGSGPSWRPATGPSPGRRSSAARDCLPRMRRRSAGKRRGSRCRGRTSCSRSPSNWSRPPSRRSGRRPSSVS